MRDVYEVLQQKELDLERVRAEVEALRLVAPLLAEASNQSTHQARSAWPPPVQENRWPLRIQDPPPSRAES